METLNQLRLLIIACIALELQEGDKKTLIKKLQNEDDKQVLNKLFWLGVDPSKFASKKGKNSKKLEEVSAARDKLRNISANLCRYTPALETVVNNITSEKLDSDTFGSLLIPNTYDGSLGQKGKVSAATAAIRRGGNLGKNDSADDRTQPKIIFFILGGMCHAEVRVISEYAKNNPQFNVIGGSTYIMKPAEYVAGISKMLSKEQYEEAKKKN